MDIYQDHDYKLNKSVTVWLQKLVKKTNSHKNELVFFTLSLQSCQYSAQR